MFLIEQTVVQRHQYDWAGRVAMLLYTVRKPETSPRSQSRHVYSSGQAQARFSLVAVASLNSPSTPPDRPSSFSSPIQHDLLHDKSP